MNRCFGKNLRWCEPERVKEIVPYLDQSDYLLDIHNTIDLSTPPFIICEHHDLLPYFDVLWCVQWLDTLHSGGSDGYMNANWKKAVCLEVGSIVDDLALTVGIAKKHISNFLAGVGNCSYPAALFEKPSLRKCSTIYHAQYGQCILVKQFREFEFVKHWTLLGNDWSKEIYMPQDGNLLFSRNTYELGEECFVVIT